MRRYLAAVQVDLAPTPTARTLTWPSRRDFLWPALLAVWVQADVWGVPPIALGHVVGPRPVLALLYAVTSLALAWRRQAPLLVLAFVVTADSAYYLAFGSPQGLGSFLPVFFGFYAVGRYSRPATLLTNDVVEDVDGLVAVDAALGLHHQRFAG